MAYLCDICGEDFEYASRLARHRARKTTCVAKTFICACGHRSASSRSLKSHAKTCSGGAPPTKAPVYRRSTSADAHITTNIDVSTNVDASTTNNYIVIGWPPGWPVPPQWPAPFKPESMVIDQKIIDRATATLAEAGDPEVSKMATSVMQVIRELHSSYTGRNVVPDPSRGDHALAFAEPGRWDTIPRAEARERLVGRVISDIGVAARAGRLPVPASHETAQAVKPGFDAHLLNVGRVSAAGYDPAGLTICAPAALAPRTRFFGHEDLADDIPDDLIISIADHLATCRHDVWGITAAPAAQAAHALIMYDRGARRREASNYTAFEHAQKGCAPGASDAWVFSRESGGQWVRLPVQEAARLYFLKVADDFVRTARSKPRTAACAPSFTVVARVADYLKAHGEPTPAARALAESEAARVLFQRASARAREYYLGACPGADAGNHPDAPCASDCGCSRGTARAILET